MPSPERPRFFATHRIFTGVPVSRGYIYDRQTGKPVWNCGHRHRNNHARLAQLCAERALRRFLRSGEIPLLLFTPEVADVES